MFDNCPVNRELTLRERKVHLECGVITVNEVRGELGLPPVAWGDLPNGTRRNADYNDQRRSDPRRST